LEQEAGGGESKLIGSVSACHRIDFRTTRYLLPVEVAEFWRTTGELPCFVAPWGFLALLGRVLGLFSFRVRSRTQSLRFAVQVQPATLKCGTNAASG